MYKLNIEQSFYLEEIKQEINKTNPTHEEVCDYVKDKLNINYDDYLINPYRTKGMVEVYRIINKGEIK